MYKEIVEYPNNRILHSNKENKLLIHLEIWMNLKNIMLKERNQTHNSSYYRCYISNSRASNIHL